jgi:hypothetical protein
LTCGPPGLQPGKFTFGGSQDGKFCLSGCRINDNQWHHLVGVIVHKSPNDNDVYKYIDGHLDSSLFDIPDIEHGSRRVLIGDENKRKWAFRGLIEEISIYNRALSADEIQQLYHKRSMALPRENNPGKTPDKTQKQNITSNPAPVDSSHQVNKEPGLTRGQEAWEKMIDSRMPEYLIRE